MGRHLAALLVVFLGLGAATPAPARPEPSTALDLSTPERALRIFVDASRAGDHETAARILDLSALSEAEAAEQGPRLARQLKFVLDQKLWIDWDLVSDRPRPDDLDAEGRYLLGRIPVDGGTVAIRMRAGTLPDRSPEWRISAGTVAAIPVLYEAHGAGWLDFLPAWFFETRLFEMAAWQWVGLLIGLLVALAISFLVAWLLRVALTRIARRTKFKWDDRLVQKSHGPLRLLAFLAVLALVASELRLSVPAREGLHQILLVGFVVGLTWLALRCVAVVAWILECRLVDEESPSRTRGARTQVLVLRKVASIVVIVVGGALVLLQFEMLRSIGTSVLASAGVVGLVVGLAAQKSISNLLAGVQLSITQPVRIDDTVIVEGEWGWVEEITLTYVVVRIWDLRRLVVPVSRFLDHPFQNWTKVSPEIMGTVFVHADYRVPVEQVRAEVERLCEASEKWDGKAAGLLVTDVTERTVQLRALVSASDAGRCWDLRCEVREGLLRFLQILDGGRYLPRARVELGEGEAGATPATEHRASAGAG
jgi:small-conductance mechanosensitive channel